eukprot:2645704-Ditylum_brightwellii.AAC.1
MLRRRQKVVDAWKTSIPPSGGLDGSSTAWPVELTPSRVMPSPMKTRATSSWHLPHGLGLVILEEVTESAKDQLTAIYGMLPRP